MNTPIVKQAQLMLNKIGMNVTLEETYHELLRQNFINIDGSPTQWAIDNGLVSEGYIYNFPHGLKEPKMTEKEKEDHDLDEVFSLMPKSAFMKNEQDDDYLINAHELIKAIKKALSKGNISSDNRKKFEDVLHELENQISNMN